MDKYDIQRIENALWVLKMYEDELQWTCVAIYTEGVKISPRDGLEILDMALNDLKEAQNDNE